MIDIEVKCPLERSGAENIAQSFALQSSCRLVIARWQTCGSWFWKARERVHVKYVTSVLLGLGVIRDKGLVVLSPEVIE